MKKPSRTTLRNKLDKIVSLIVRERGHCQRCGKRDNLQCCHIFSRIYNATRWLLDNLLCLCSACHFFFHKNPILFGEYVRELLGEERYLLLKESRNRITKYTTEDLETKYKVLSEMSETLKGGRNV